MTYRLEGEKIIDAKEMARIESEAISDGASSEKFMHLAAQSFAYAIERFILEHNLSKQITFFCGKGNNGGDGYATALILLERGFDVKAFYLYEVSECSALNRKFFRLLQNQSRVFSFDLDAKIQGLIVDALLGTGFEGELDEKLAHVIDFINENEHLKIALDVPSGLSGNHGARQKHIVKAFKTFYLEAPKTGFFINKGFEYVSQIEKVSFSLDPKYLDRALGFGFLLFEKELFKILPPMEITQHKYQRGYVVALAGSKGMEGAALLSCQSAMRSGAGIVRLFYEKEMEKSLSNSFVELIKSLLDFDHFENLFDEAARAKSLLIGPGIGHDEKKINLIIELLSRFDIPTIIDADMILPFVEKAKNYPKQMILSPHRKEMERCLSIKNPIDDEDFLEKCQAFVEDKKVTLILKGMPTFILSNKKPILTVYGGDKGMATAGSGDVLTGVIAGLLSRGVKAREAAALGVYLHFNAGKIASEIKGSISLMASDILDHLSDAFLQLEAHNE